MPKVTGGAYGADPELVRNLLVLFRSWNRNGPDDPEALAAKIAAEASWTNLEKSQHEGQVESLTGERRHTSGDYNSRVSNYLEALKNARAAWLELPQDAQEIMHMSYASCKTSAFNQELLRLLASATIWRREHSRLFEEWRLDGLKEHDKWGSDLEMLDLLIYGAMHFQEVHSPSKHARDRWEPSFIKCIANICTEYGVKPSASSNGHFVAILSLLLPGRDVQDLARQALKRGKYSEKSGNSPSR